MPWLSVSTACPGCLSTRDQPAALLGCQLGFAKSIAWEPLFAVLPSTIILPTLLARSARREAERIQRELEEREQVG